MKGGGVKGVVPEASTRGQGPGKVPRKYPGSGSMPGMPRPAGTRKNSPYVIEIPSPGRANFRRVVPCAGEENGAIVEAMAGEDTVLLHLSDLHFGADETAAGITDRALCLDRLFESISALESDWRPTAVVVTGDIGWAGKKTDYEDATSWLQKVSAATGIPPKAFVFCPGNHDVDRALATEITRPHDTREVKKIFANRVPPYLEQPFEQYVAFCESFGAEPLSFGSARSHLIGTTTAVGLRFVVVNTSWFSQDNQDKLKLWIGMPLIHQLERDKCLLRERAWSDRPITVALLHHPSEWLHEQETTATQYPDQGAYLYLASRCHLLLGGHTHEVSPGRARAKGGGIVLGCGATFASSGHPNQYQLIRFKTDQLEFRRIKYINEAPTLGWKALDVESVLYSDSGVSSAPSSTAEFLSIASIQERLGRHARDYALMKSKALTPGALPEITPLMVETGVTPAPQEHQSDAVERLPLAQVLADTRRIMIWGDLGTGKSTLVASLVDELNRTLNKVAILLPATSLLPFLGKAPQPLSADAISSCLRRLHFQETPAFDIVHTVVGRVDETVIVVDGLDEISAKAARQILQGLDALPSSFARVRTIATSRHVPDDYAMGSDWVPVSTARLNDEERRAILCAAASASGLHGKTAVQSSEGVFRRIAEDALLDEVATSPLALRLLYRRLTRTPNSEDLSLPVLLQGLLIERLHNWEHADAKENPAPAFCEAVPSAEGRATLLSALASNMAEATGVEHTRALACLRAHPLLSSSSEKARIQALEFFQWTGLIRLSDDHVEFALRPLFEIAQVPDMLDRLRKDPTTVDFNSWRIVAFAAALERSRGTLSLLAEALSKYVDLYVKVPRWAVPACFIAAESGDGQLSQKVVATLGARRFARPLYQFADQQRTSAIAIARTISLAGDQGFQWFFDEYLDPRYPWIDYASRTPEAIFEEWVALVGDKATPKNVELLSKIPRPHLMADSHATLGIVPLAVLAAPSSVSTTAQLDILPRLVTHRTPLIVARAKERLRALALREPCVARRALLRHVTIGFENSVQCSLLWLQAAPSEPPPAEVVLAALRSRCNWDGAFFEDELRSQLIERLGEATWLRLCKWQVANEDPQISLGATLELIDRVPAMAQLLDDQLLAGLRYARGVQGTEKLLASIYATAPPTHARRLAARLGNLPKSASGYAPPAWWRLFLDSIEADSDSDAPALLARAAGGIGDFTVARDAELRRRFRSLSTGPRGPEYVDTLNALLKFGTGVQRYGAAQILICMNEHLVAALLTCARASADLLNHSWEWEDFCASVRFPSTVIDALMSRKAGLSEKARLFVVRLAAANGRTLDHQDAALVLAASHRSALVDPLASTEVGFEILVGLLRGDDEKRASEAAILLLRHHRGNLGEEVATCEILAFEPRGYMTYANLAEQYRDLRANRGRCDAICKKGGELAGRFGHSFVFPMLANSVHDQGIWRNLLWSLFCEHGDLREDELLGWMLLGIGNDFPDVREAIGMAARGLCFDLRLQSPAGLSWRAWSWFGFFASEFGTLAANEVADLLKKHQVSWRHNSVVPALIARTGLESPSSNPPPDAPSSRKERVSIDTLIDAVRDGAPVTPIACSLIGRSLYDDREPTELAQLSASGRRARVLSGILAFIYGQRAPIEWVLEVLDRGVWNGTDDQQCIDRFGHLGMLALRAAVAEDRLAVTTHLRGLIRGRASEEMNAARLLHSLGCCRADWLMGKRADSTMGIVRVTVARAVLAMPIVESARQG